MELNFARGLQTTRGEPPEIRQVGPLILIPTATNFFPVYNQDEVVFRRTFWCSISLEAVFLVLGGLPEAPEAVLGLGGLGVSEEQGGRDCGR